MRPIQSDTTTGIIAVWAVECVAALLLIIQRGTGLLDVLPSPTAVLLFAVVCLAVNLMALVLLRAPLRKAFESRLNGGAVIFAVSLPPLAIGFALLHPDADGQRAALWLGVVFTAATVPWMTRTRPNARAGGVSPPHPTLRFPVPDVDSRPVAVDAVQCEIDDDTAGATRPRHAQDETSQWMQRRLADDGSSETLEGEFTATFTAGQKTAVVHLAFMPPLSGIPELECEPQDGGDVRWKLAVAQPYGVRIDVQRSGSIRAPAEVRLAWFATTQIRSAEAA